MKEANRFKMVMMNMGLSDAAFSYGMASEEFHMAWLNYLAAFESLDPVNEKDVIEGENPAEHIFEAIRSEEDPEYIEKLIQQFGEMTEWLEKIEYSNAEAWRAEFEECAADFSAYFQSLNIQ